MTNTTVALLLDAILVVVVLATVLYYRRKGFVAGLLDLVGNLVALALAWVVSGRLSPTLFDNFFKSGLITRTSQMMQQQGSVNVNSLLGGLSGLLPQRVLDDLSAKAGALFNTNAPDVAEQLVENIIAPLIVPIITVLVFFITFLLVRLVVSLLVTVLTNVNKIPVLGGVNRFLGILVGLLAGLLNAVILLCLVWAVVAITGGSLPLLNQDTLSGSYFYTVFYACNPFLQA